MLLWCFFDKHLASGVRAHHTMLCLARAHTHPGHRCHRSLQCSRFTRSRTCTTTRHRTLQIVTTTSSIVHTALRGACYRQPGLDVQTLWRKAVYHDGYLSKCLKPSEKHSSGDSMSLSIASPPC
ncbi:uncharacterized protein CC84DRAFT_129592 [Paraphaeosphaeria sporulosa]|uniref:Uncharacterized protein n=1 Tax=Paraphaeosphaeria sporulosa TaxID=1460663 RepID=A0A177CYM0_9PLEO|nr:uncharacterized protein CC84DRAFT_129592 [Paraphaeosphaeria sporulosa]OAG12603.1 hypothetical protein CC84DRAFT_129592 [Paraphaeosphaeria sporulosa]